MDRLRIVEHRSEDIGDALYVLDDNNNLSTMYFAAESLRPLGLGGAGGGETEPLGPRRSRRGQGKGRNAAEDSGRTSGTLPTKYLRIRYRFQQVFLNI